MTINTLLPYLAILFTAASFWMARSWGDFAA